MMEASEYPFSAIVGQEAMKSALLLNAVDPSIGGVLIRGQKGTGKSTAARALASLLPPIEMVADCPYQCPPDRPEMMHAECRERFQRSGRLASRERPMPLIELPLNATEDRLVGTIELAETLRSGERHFQPGLLAAVNRGILYVDEVNLLPDHLVDLLLDTAASGVNRVEREGLSIRHPSRFLLIGTMNPEEGELRPQFLDRFGLAVTVNGISDPILRRQLLHRRLAFDADPAGFAARWREHDAFLAEQVAAARQRLPRLACPDALLQQAAELAVQAGVHGHRADLTLLKTARALAALQDDAQPEDQHLYEAARLVLPHRLPEDRHRQSIEKLLAELFPGSAVGDPPEVSGTASEVLDINAETAEFPGAAAAGSMLFETFKKKLRNVSSG